MAEDTKITSAINLVLSFDRQDIIDAYKQAETHIGQSCDLQLMTAHTSKGTTRDIVELDDDLNSAIEDIIKKPFTILTEEERAELCLYFVAISRHRFQLINAKHLERLMND